MSFLRKIFAKKKTASSASAESIRQIESAFNVALQAERQRADSLAETVRELIAAANAHEPLHYSLLLSGQERKVLVRVMANGMYGSFKWATVQPVSAEGLQTARDIFTKLGVLEEDISVVNEEGEVELIGRELIDLTLRPQG